MVDCFSKYDNFVSTLEAYPAEMTTELFYRNVVKHFDLSSDIISDRDA